MRFSMSLDLLKEQSYDTMSIGSVKSGIGYSLGGVTLLPQPTVEQSQTKGDAGCHRVCHVAAPYDLKGR
jgi:hypothetical protein